jgi:ATP-dependent Clp protease ATP-binding subunit ClpC
VDLVIPLYIREPPDGPALCVPVDLPFIPRVADRADDAIAQVVPAVIEWLQANDDAAHVLAALTRPRDLRLELVRVEVRPRRRAAPEAAVRLRVGVVLERLAPEGAPAHTVMYAPEFPVPSRIVADVDNLQEEVSEWLNNTVRKVSPRALLSRDAIGAVRLDSFTLPGGGPAEAPAGPAQPPSPPPKPPEILTNCGTELTALPAERLHGIDRRDAIVERVIHALTGPGSRSVVLVGPNGVGKTALVHELAARLQRGDVPESLRGFRLWRLSANELIAGAQYTGQWQDRVTSLLRATAGQPIVLAMGPPSALIDAGKWSGSDNNMSRLLRPYIEDGDIAMVFEATATELEAARRSEPGFIAALLRVDMAEPAADDVAAIVRAAAERLETAHGVSVTPEGRDAALSLTRRFEPSRALPGKAVQLLGEAARDVAARGEPVVDRAAALRSFAARTGLPTSLLSDDERMDPADVRAFLEQRVLGQPDAVDAMVDLLTVIKADLQDPAKPLGSFLFAGPTGVGKTELAKALAELVFSSRDRMIRFDMGEFTAGDAVARLVGSAWRREHQAELPRRLREQPFCVLLFDEVEKAHADVFDVLLAALGEGHVTDADGRTADLRNAIVIMTTNLGARKAGRTATGFASAGNGRAKKSLTRHYVDAAEKFFRPEFFNRIDRVVAFAPLERETVGRIARREVGRLLLREGVARRKLLIEVDEAVIDELAASGFDPVYGARPLKRAIEGRLIVPLSRLIVERSPGAGDLIRCTVAKGAIRLHHEPVATAEETVAAPPAAVARTVATAAQSARDAAALALAERETDAARRAEELRERLIFEIGRPDFWDTPDPARRTMISLYRLDTAIERLDALTRRAEGLEQLAARATARRDRSRLADLVAAAAEVEAERIAVATELEAAVSSDWAATVVLRVTPVGPDAEAWAAEIHAMYVAWAARSGREPGVVETDAGPALEFEGTGAAALLAGEAGLHRLDGAGERLLARVAVEIEGVGPPADPAGAVVRTYRRDARAAVRDPRTGVRCADVASVLRDGAIEPFLLAALRQT